MPAPAAARENSPVPSRLKSFKNAGKDMDVSTSRAEVAVQYYNLNIESINTTVEDGQREDWKAVSMCWVDHTRQLHIPYTTFMLGMFPFVIHQDIKLAECQKTLGVVDLET